jgi:hypothetical protein
VTNFTPVKALAWVGHSQNNQPSAFGLRRNGKYIENLQNIQEIGKWLRGEKLHHC